MNAQPATLTSAESCLGETLLDADGHFAGRISDLLINPRTGHVDFVRVSVEPDDAEQRYIAVPWSVVQAPDAEAGAWKVRARRETLHGMARFEVKK